MFILNNINITLYNTRMDQNFEEDKSNNDTNIKMKESLIYEGLLVFMALRLAICGFFLIISILLSIISYSFHWRYITPQRIFIAWVFLFILFSAFVIYQRIKLYMIQNKNAK